MNNNEMHFIEHANIILFQLVKKLKDYNINVKASGGYEYSRDYTSLDFIEKIDELDFSQHDKPFKDEITQLKHDLREAGKEINKLKTELSAKENLLKSRNSVDECQDAVGFLLHSDPISVARQLINANYEHKRNDLEKAFGKISGCDCETVVENVYSVSELRQIAEHLLVYCNHNSEDENE